MRRRFGLIALIACAGILGAGASVGATQGCSWERVDAPDPGPVVALNDVVALSPSDVWAVGSWNSGGEFNPNAPLVIQWDGSDWNVADIDGYSQTKTHSLVAVDALTPNDIWAVGWMAETERFGAIGQREPLILHFDGQTWTQMSGLQTSHSATTLSDVVAVGPQDVWIVGTRHNPSGLEKSLILHHSNESARVVRSGNRPGQSRSLTAVTAAGSRTMWAVGTRSWSSGRSSAIALRFNGRERQTFRIPAPLGAQDPNPSDVAAATPTDLWAVGSYREPNSSGVFVARSDARSWWQADPPPMGTGGINDFKTLNGVDALASNDVWAVGNDSTDDSQGERRTRVVMAHWNGSAWTLDSHDTGQPAWLEEIEVSPDDTAWAVGTTYTEPDDSEPSFAPPMDGLILHRSCS